jgi:hypothetical protein
MYVIGEGVVGDIMVGILLLPLVVGEIREDVMDGILLLVVVVRGLLGVAEGDGIADGRGMVMVDDGDGDRS